MKEFLSWPEIAVLAGITLLLCLVIVRRSTIDGRKRRRDDMRRHVDDKK